jgi:hypothetical protein
MHLILASASPRRAELLTSAGYRFEVAPAHVDETPGPNEPPRAYALRVARDKARAVLAACAIEGAVVLGADTVVVCDGALLEKPVDAADAARMLRALSGRVHEVHTAVVVMAEGREQAEAARRSPGTWHPASRRARPAVTRSRGVRRGSFPGSRAPGRMSSGCRSRPSPGCLHRLKRSILRGPISGGNSYDVQIHQDRCDRGRHRSSWRSPA